MSSTKLYSYWRSSCAWRVRAALLYKKIPYEYVAVDLVKDGGQQKSDLYKSLNPAALVPTLLIDGNTFTESLAMIEYLEETHPEPSLLPRDPVGRATVRALSLHIAAGIQPIQNTGVLNYVGEEKKVEWVQYWIIKGLRSFEAMLAKTAGHFCYGDSVTMADCCLVPQVYNAIRYTVDMSQFPICQRVVDELMKLEPFQLSHPSRQPDTPENQKVAM